MKHKTPNEKLAKSQNREFVADEFAGSTKHMRIQRNDTFYSESTTLMMAPITPPAGGAGERLLNQNLGKAPPGQSRSPGAARGHPPENKGDPPRSVPLSLGREGPEPDEGRSLSLSKGRVSYPTNRTTLQIEKEELTNKNQNSNYYKRLIFTIMKKQILFLMVFVLAAFASVNKSYGQCDDALHPVAGKAYTYSITVSPTGGTFDWYVATSADLMAATATKADGTYVTGGTGYNNPGTGTASVDITWSAKAVAEALAGTTKFYLVVHYTTNPACTDNYKAYVITPINLFQILVENINSSAGAYADICRSSVVSATVNAAGNAVTFDYGENALYLKVTAKYFTTSWTPKIDMTVLNASLTAPQVVKSIEWSLTTTFTGTGNFDLSTGLATTVVPDKGGDGITSGTDEFVYIKIIITDGKFEGTGDQTIALNVSAKDASGNPDTDLDATCNAITPDPDNVTQVLKLRPGLTSTTPITVPAAGTGAFLPAVP